MANVCNTVTRNKNSVKNISHSNPHFLLKSHEKTKMKYRKDKEETKAFKLQNGIVWPINFHMSYSLK